MLACNAMVRLAASTSILILLTANQLQAQDAGRVERLEERVNGMDSKLDAIFQMLQKQSGAASQSGNSPPNAAPESQDKSEVDQSKYKRGMNLDLHLVPLPKTDDDLALKVFGTPTATEIIAAPTQFEWGVFATLPSMRQFTNRMPDKRVGLNWNGYLQIKDGGQNEFVVDVIVDQGSSTTFCVGTLSLDAVPVVTAVSPLRKPDALREVTTVELLAREKRFSTETGSVKLERGLHKFSLWGHCLGSKADFSKVHFALRQKAPADRAPAPVSPDLFLIDRD